MTFFRECIPLFLIALSVLAFPLASLAIWPGVVSANSDPDCATDPNLRIDIGETFLSVPRRYGPNIFDSEDTYVGRAKDICQRLGDLAIEAREIMVIPGADNRFALEPQSYIGPVWDVQIQIRNVFPSLRTPQETYNYVVRYIEKEGKKLHALPNKHGFFAYDSVSPGPRFYVTPQKTSVWFDPAPLVIECSSDEIPSATGRVYYGHTCQTSYYRLNNTLAVRYIFQDGRHPIESWIELDASVHAFVQNLVQNGP